MSSLADTIESTGHDHGTEKTPAEEVPNDRYDAPAPEQEAPAEHEHGSHGH